ncbi:WD40 repeat domain-containing protein, partial [Endozoicomonas sp. SESOKO4]|uniref:WD40 repeat domain-containing protein n=1 Tax=Endozoicomonas sp. SESOKO4 TaxID=2828745 RepID=UPI0021476C6A
CCDKLVDATFDLTGERLYVAAKGKNQAGDTYSHLGLFDMTRTNRTLATALVKVKGPVLDSQDFRIKLDATGRLVGIAGNSLKLWYARVSNGTLPYLATLDNDFNGIYSFDFSRKSDKLAAGYNDDGDNYLGVWDTYQLEDNKPKLLAKVKSYPAVSIQFHPTGRYVLSGIHVNSYGSFAELWDLSEIKSKTPSHIKLNENGARPYIVTFDHEGRQIGVSMVDDNFAVLWHMDSIISGDTDPLAFMGHDDDVYFIAFDPTGRYIVTTSGDHTAKLWDGTQIKKNSPKLLATMNHGCAVKQAIFIRNNTRVFTRSDCDIRLWDIQHIPVDGKAKLLNTFHTDGGYYKIELDPAAIWLLTVNIEAAEIWDIAALQPDSELSDAD